MGDSNNGLGQVTRRLALAGGGVVAAGAALGVAALALRDGGALVPGRARARPVASDAAAPAVTDVVVIGG
ncbi:hypothetical protein PMI01_02983, partial [Caulobacter sp. AP07]